MESDEDGVCYVSPEGGVCHAYVADVALESLSRSVGGGAVVAVAAEDAVETDVGTGEDVESVAPCGVRQASYVVEGDAVGASHGACANDESVDENVGGARGGRAMPRPRMLTSCASLMANVLAK